MVHCFVKLDLSQESGRDLFRHDRSDRMLCAGKLLQQWIRQKYSKSYDLSIVKRDIPGKALVRLNVMWTHLEQACQH